MKKNLLALLIWSFTITCAIAQVTAELTVEQEQTLPGEPLPVAVRITNRAGRTLEMGEADNWLEFSVFSQEVSGGIVQKLDEVPVTGKFQLPSSKRATKRVDLAPYYALLKPGKYSVTATVRIPGLDQEIRTEPASFYVVEGTSMWEREVGIPGTNTTSTGAPLTRRYILQQATHVRGEPRLYLRITDGAGNRFIKLVLLGVIPSFSRPNPQVDGASNLHLLYQNGPATFSYQVISPLGNILKRQTYEFYGDSKPRLLAAEDGWIVVEGGVRRVSASDIPAPLTPTPPDASNNATNSTPSTNSPATR